MNNQRFSSTDFVFAREFSQNRQLSGVKPIVDAGHEFLPPPRQLDRSQQHPVPSPSETWFRGMVFPAGVGPGSPSRDAANWLPSRSDLSVETRRQYGWLRMVFSGVRLFRAPIWWPSGGWRHARGREHCRGEPGGSLSGGYAPDSAKAEGSSIVDEPGEG